MRPDATRILIEGQRLSTQEYTAACAFVGNLQMTETGRAMVAKVQRMIYRSEYKRRQTPPILRLRPRAFGTGRQMPIAAYYP